jgi:GTPase SAR1 family protein
MIIVGNKCDLLEERQVSYQEGAEFASKYKVPFYETSAKTNFNVIETFSQCARLYWQYNYKEDNKKDKKTKKVKKGLFDSISDDNDVDIKFKKN